MPSGTARNADPAASSSARFPGRWGVALVGVPLLAAAYFVSGKLGLRVAVANENATTVWPPTGIALAALLVFGLRLWPGVFLGALLVNLTTSGLWLASSGIALGNTLEAVVGSFLVARCARGRLAFERVRDVFAFALLAPVLSTMVSATLGVASLAANEAVRSDHFQIWLTWWLGDLGGALLLAPFLILWSSWRPSGWNAARVLEGMLLILSLTVLSVAVFGGVLPFSPKNYAIGFLCIPMVLWSALRFGPRYTSAVIVLLSAVALWGTIRQSGSFPRETKIETFVFLQAFLGVISITALAVAAAVEERKRSALELEERLREVARLNIRLDGLKEEIAVYHRLLTHDITNVSMALMGLLDRLLIQADGPLTSAQEDLLRRLNRQVLEMNRMSENARTLLRLREQGFPPSGQPAALHEVLTRAVGHLRDLHFDRPFESIVECPPDATLAGMPLIDSVLLNLLDNAVRHNPKGSKPEVKARVLPAGDRMTIEIRGGVPPPGETLARLFEAGSNGHPSSHGIGLILVREIVQRASGTIAVRTVSETRGDVLEVTLSLPSSPAGRSLPDGSSPPE
ncbi:MAG: MASE1 domain-containing protein [Planctomycetes bacterium]|nr:MASE1 domain-containing protein [Planctomycetota bacterium]